MFECSHVTHVYPGCTVATVSDVTLAVAPGERVALVGANGSGKSTVVALANGSVTPTSGRVLADGLRVDKARPAEVARFVGVVGQDPMSQLVYSTVWDEVAFGPRCLGLPAAKVEERVLGALRACGLASLASSEVKTLSTGQAQLLALAGVLATRPAYLVLDEACAHLDLSSRVAVMKVVDALVSQGVGVLQVTHDVRELAGANRVIELSSGAIVWSGDVDAWVAKRSACDSSYGARRGDASCHLAPYHHEARGEGLRLEHVSVDLGDASVLRDVTLDIPAGNLTLVMGASGSGKTTLARVAAGLLVPDDGTVTLGGKPVAAGEVGMSFTRASTQLFAATVAEDVALGPRNVGLDSSDAALVAARAMSATGITTAVAASSPFSISGGEQRRAALAGIIAASPPAYVFDEPMAALDDAGVASVRSLVNDLVASGAAVVVVTHDVEPWRDVANRAVVLSSGSVAFCGEVGAAAEAQATLAHDVIDEAPEAGRAAMVPSMAATSCSAPFTMAGEALVRIPASLKVVTLLAVTIALFLGGGLTAMVLLVMALATLWAVSGVRGVVAVLAKAAIVMSFALLGNVVVIGGTASGGMVTLSAEGAARGLLAACRIATLVMSSSVVARTTTASAIGEAVTTPLRLMRTGVGPALAVQVAITAVPQVGETFVTTVDAMRARGLRVGVGSLVRRLRSYATALVPTTLAMFVRASDLSSAMVARGYEGNLPPCD